MSQLNEIYKKAYLKSIGEDVESKKRKRDEALEYIDAWIEEQSSSSSYERMFNQGKSQYYQETYDIRIKHGISKKEKEKMMVEEFGTEKEYATDYAREYMNARITLNLITSIRTLFD